MEMMPLIELLPEMTLTKKLNLSSQHASQEMAALEASIAEDHQHQKTRSPSLNFQPAINGSPPTANQSAPEISPLAALRKEPQSHQRETDSKASGPTSQARPPSSQESSQETVLPTTTSTERGV